MTGADDWRESKGEGAGEGERSLSWSGWTNFGGHVPQVHPNRWPSDDPGGSSACVHDRRGVWPIACRGILADIGRCGQRLCLLDHCSPALACPEQSWRSLSSPRKVRINSDPSAPQAGKVKQDGNASKTLA